MLKLQGGRQGGRQAGRERGWEAGMVGSRKTGQMGGRQAGVGVLGCAEEDEWEKKRWAGASRKI